jgi:hypothetical protein
MNEEPDVSMAWWYARFRIKWPEDTDPAWHVDLLLAHRIIAPVLDQYRGDIVLWRFHRRAARDDEGHQFSLTFYSSPETANIIFDRLRSDALLRKMRRAGVIIRDIYDNTRKSNAPNIEDTSDGHWAVPIKRSWPFFIMGVCQMWLSLIVQITDGMAAKKKISSLPKMLAFYRQADEEIRTLWREQGGHSLLHHLNAIFGYEPVLVREVQLKRF